MLVAGFLIVLVVVGFTLVGLRAWGAYLASVPGKPDEGQE